MYVAVRLSRWGGFKRHVAMSGLWLLRSDLLLLPAVPQVEGEVPSETLYLCRSAFAVHVMFLITFLLSSCSLLLPSFLLALTCSQSPAMPWLNLFPSSDAVVAISFMSSLHCPPPPTYSCIWRHAVSTSW